MLLDDCPECTYRLSAPADTCPRCGVIFAKLVQAEARHQIEEHETEPGRVRQLLFHVKGGENSSVLPVQILANKHQVKSSWLFHQQSTG